jgi:hypothetical protein
MIKILYKINKLDNIKIFLYSYFTIDKWKYIRIFSGPLLICIGVFLLYFPNTFQIAFGGFAIGYGIFMLIRPFLRLIYINKKYEESEILFIYHNKNEIEINTIKFKGKLKVDKIEIKEIGNWCIILKIKHDNDKMNIIIPKKSVIEGNLDKLLSVKK